MPGPPNQTCASASLISTLPFSTTVDTTVAGNSPSTPDDNCGSGNSYNSVWYRWVCPVGQTRLTITASDTDREGVVTVLSGSCGSLFEVDCDSDNLHFTIDVLEGTTYFFLVTSYDPGGVAAQHFALSQPTPDGDLCAFLSCSADDAEIDAFGMDCDSGLVTFTGTTFLAGFTLVLTGPGGVVPFTLIGFSLTEIVIQITVPIASGVYCATIANVGRSPSAPVCQAISCAPPEPPGDGCAVDPGFGNADPGPANGCAASPTFGNGLD